MRAVKIDPVSRTVTEINLKKNPNNTLQELYEIIGCDLVELVQIDRDMVMVVEAAAAAVVAEAIKILLNVGRIYPPNWI